MSRVAATSESTVDLLGHSKLPLKYGAGDYLQQPLHGRYSATNGTVSEQIENGGITAVNMSFHNIMYEVGTGSCFNRSYKTILNDLNGEVPQGLNAIMGPTGSGKTRSILANYNNYRNKQDNSCRLERVNQYNLAFCIAIGC